MSSWNAGDMPDQSGKVALVTGGNSGIGFETAKALANAGAQVIITSRSEQNGQEAVQKIKEARPTAKIETLALDLANQASIATFAQGLLDRGQAIDLLINNAGVMAVPERRLTPDGFEMHMGTNHFGHFALTARLWPLLLQGHATRVITVSSAVARWADAKIAFDDMEYEHNYAPMAAYSRSKIANILLALELERRAHPLGVTSIAVHPGTSFTNLQKFFLPPIFNPIMRPIFNGVIGQSAEHSALPSLYAATRPDVNGDSFYGPTGRGEMRGAPGKVPFPPPALDQEVARQLWELSEERTHLPFLTS